MAVLPEPPLLLRGAGAPVLAVRALVGATLTAIAPPLSESAHVCLLLAAPRTILRLLTHQRPAQERELGVFFDTIIVCSVTGSTQAGMIAGFAAQERERRVIGIDGSATPRETWEQVARIARRTAELIELGRDLREDEIVLDDRYHAGTYGIPDERTLEAIRLAGRLEGMITDPVYEGKSMAGMIDLVTSGEIGRGSNVLYAHLGGQPALNGYASLFAT
jgi:1-aminocyclopropane-1-carboxylate deaminase